MAKISVICTVFNESDNIEQLISALRRQSLPPSEVVIVDGGSPDGTNFILTKLAKKWPVLKVYQVKGNRSVGRNFAVTKTKAPLIAITDAGCFPEPNWLAELAKPFSNSQTQVVSGYYRGVPSNTFQKCLIPYVLVMPDKAGKSEFFPATRSMALRRTVWDKSGGFNPHLWHNEDFEFAHRLKHLGYSFVFAPKAIVNWFPRQNLKQAAWMFMRFAIGDIQAGILRPKVKLLAIRYLVFIFLCFLYWPFFLLIIPYLIWAIFKNFRYVKDIRAFFWLPVLQITADVSVLFGTLVGLLSRIAT